MMHKKHFEEIAQTLYEEDAHDQLIFKIADILQKTNSKFNRKLFILKSTQGEGDEAKW